MVNVRRINLICLVVTSVFLQRIRSTPELRLSKRIGDPCNHYIMSQEIDILQFLNRGIIYSQRQNFASAFCGHYFDHQWRRSRYALLMRPNTFVTAVQQFCISGAVFAGFSRHGKKCVGATTQGQSGPGSNSNDNVLHTHYISRTRASSLSAFSVISRKSFLRGRGNFTLLHGMQSVYSKLPRMVILRIVLKIPGESTFFFYKFSTSLTRKIKE